MIILNINLFSFCLQFSSLILNHHLNLNKTDSSQMSSEINKYFYEQKLEYLTDQNNQLRQQNELFKTTNDNLIKTLAEANGRSQDFNLQIKNRELEELLDMEKKRYQELENRRYQEIRTYKKELNDRNNEIERMRIEHEKQIFRMSQEIRYLKSQLRARRNENYNFEQLSKSMAISSYLVDLKQSEENSIDRSNQMNYTNIERMSRSPAHSQISNMQKSRTNVSTLTSNELMKFSKEELKVALKTLSKAGKSLREGEREVSILQERQSFIKSKKN